MKKQALLEYSREHDGTKLIAISFKGRTKLGRMLAAGAHIPVEISGRGDFASLAAFIRFMNGDRRNHVREESGPDYDDALNESVPEPYHEVLQDYVKAMFNSPRGLEAEMIALLQKNHLPLAVYQDADGELVPTPMPVWYAEVLNDIRDRVVAPCRVMGDALKIEAALEGKFIHSPTGK